MLVVDTRWRGEHGIARFASEVVRRIELPFRTISGQLSPASPLDSVNPGRAMLRKTDLLFSPGYNAGITRATQLLTVHDLIHLNLESETSSLKRAYFNRLVRPAIRRAGSVMTVSETSADALREWLSADDVQVVNVGNGCSDAFRVDGPIYDSEKDYLLYVGNVTKPHKNFGVLLEALALRPDYRLVAVANEAVELQRRAAETGVGDRVTALTGVPDPELAAVYRGAYGVLFPSLLEGFGLPAVEAMRCGKRVAYWRGCESLAEIIGESGPVVSDATSAEEWAVAMDRLVEGAASEDPIARAASYEWDAVAANVRREVAALL